MSLPFSRPMPPATFTIGDHAGEVVIIIVGGYHEAVPTRQFGEKPAARVTVVMLTGRTAGTVHEDVMLFGQKLASQFMACRPGEPVLGRLSKVDKSVTLEPGSSYDEQTALAWMTAYPGKLDELRASAVKTYEEACRTMAAGRPAGAAPAPSPQFSAPAPAQTAVAASEPAGEVTPGQAYGNGAGTFTTGSMSTSAPAATHAEAGF